MRIRTLTAALTAAALVCSSAPSFAQTGTPEPAASVEDGAALSHEGVEHRKRRRGATLWAVAGFIAIAFAALLLFSDDQGDPEPISP